MNMDTIIFFSLISVSVIGLFIFCCSCYLVYKQKKEAQQYSNELKKQQETEKQEKVRLLKQQEDMVLSIINANL